MYSLIIGQHLFSILCLQQAADVEVGTDVVPSITVKVLYLILDCNVPIALNISSYCHYCYPISSLWKYKINT